MENIPLPSKIETIKINENETKFVFEPLYPGYGITVGNALRRVLLSSLPGAAVQAIKLKGVDHEFSTIPHVKEDIVSLILNFKQLRFKFNGNDPVTITLKAKGEKEVTGADIKTTADLEVVNKKLHLATLTDKAAVFELEITVSPGRGYVPVEMREKEVLELGNIAIDAIYTPVKNVNFNVENVRVEQMTNYDRLILDIITDGTMTPEQALKMSAEILVNHFDFVKILKMPKIKEQVEDKKLPQEAILISEKKEEEVVDLKVKEEVLEDKDKIVKKKRGRPKKTESII